MTTKAKVTAVIAAFAVIILVRLIFYGSGAAAVFRPAVAAAGQHLSYASDSGAAFYSYDSKGYFFCAKDSVKYISTQGGQQWESAVSLTSPVICGKCGMLAVGEPKGNTIYVFDAQGKAMECRPGDPVLNFSVNRAGDLTVILQTPDGYRVETYARGKDSPVWKYAMVKPNIYPISADTSPDGKVTAVCALDLSPDARQAMAARIMFIYTDQSDAAKIKSADGIFAGFSLPGQIARVSFMDRRLLAVSDASVTAYGLKDNGKVNMDWQISLTNKITRFCTYGETGFAFVTGGPLEGAQNPQAAGTLNTYGMNGRRTGCRNVGAGADYLSMNWGCAIVGSGRDFIAVDSRGGFLWQYKSPEDIKQLIMLDNENTALSAGATSAMVMRRGA